MRIYAPLLAAALAIATLVPASAANHKPKSNNANVKRATKKAKKYHPPKYKPAKYKAPKKTKRPAHS